MNETKTPPNSPQAPETPSSQLQPEAAYTGPGPDFEAAKVASEKTSPSKKKSPVASKSSGGGKGESLTALLACRKHKADPFKAVIDIMNDSKVNPSIRLQAAQTLINRIEPEKQAVRVDEPKAPAIPVVPASSTVTEAKVMKLVDKI